MPSNSWYSSRFTRTGHLLSSVHLEFMYLSNQSLCFQRLTIPLFGGRAGCINALWREKVPDNHVNQSKDGGRGCSQNRHEHAAGESEPVAVVPCQEEEDKHCEPFAKFASRWDLLPGRVVIPGSAGVPPAQDLAGSWRLASQGWSVHLPTGAGAAPLQECGRDARAPRGKPMAGQVQIRILQKAHTRIEPRGLLLIYEKCVRKAWNR